MYTLGGCSHTAGAAKKLTNFVSVNFCI